MSKFVRYFDEREDNALFSKCNEYYGTHLNDCQRVVQEIRDAVGTCIFEPEALKLFHMLSRKINHHQIKAGNPIPYEYNFIWWLLEGMKCDLTMYLPNEIARGLYAARLKKFMVAYENYFEMCPHDTSYNEDSIIADKFLSHGFSVSDYDEFLCAKSNKEAEEPQVDCRLGRTRGGSTSYHVPFL